MSRPAGFKVVRWTAEEKAELVRMKTEGTHTDREIGQAIGGRSEAAVWQMWWNIRPRDEEWTDCAHRQPYRVLDKDGDQWL